MKTSLLSCSAAFFVIALGLASCAQGTAQTTSPGTDDGGGVTDTSTGDASTDGGGGDAMAGDCPMVCTGATPFCDTSTRKCVECLPTSDACPATTFCLKDTSGAYHCAPGCKSTAECTAPGDAGASDAGSRTSLACCNHACVDTTSSTTSCGTCGHTCGTDGGVAACCSSLCVDTAASALNCGGCGLTCTASHVSNATCAMAACGYDVCWPGYGDCDGNKANGCEAPTSADPMRCGGCTDVCSSNHITTPTCVSSICSGACDPGYADCNTNKLTDGCETGTAVDPQNCGGCATRCSNSHIAAPTCAMGTCNGACDLGFADCNMNKQTDGCEVNIATDTQSCGGCGIGCSTANIAMPTCGGGICTGACNVGFGDCNSNKQADGCERALNTLTDCAACGAPCAPANASGATCAALSCNYGACNAGFQDCDSNRANGCESNTSSDNANCGSCGNRCTGSLTCLNGACSARKVLIAASDYDATLQALQTALQGTGAFSGVDEINVSNSTPTVAQLQAYSVVLAWSQTGGGQNEASFYDNLATYYDGGGRVVLALFIVGGYPGGAVGRFLQPGNGYMLFNVTSSGYTSGGALALGTVLEPASPLMTGVASVTSGPMGYWSTEPLLAGATVVANWNNGAPLIVRGQAQGRNRVDLNMWPNTANFGGNALTLIKNALLYQ